MKQLALGILLLLGFSSNAFGREGDTLKDRDWRIEAEPASFVYRGFNLHISRNITKDNRLNIGLYAISLDLPPDIEKGLFKNVTEDAKVRLGFEAALVTRYMLRRGPLKFLNPYAGLITGYEYFDVRYPAIGGVRITTGVVTPFLGCEVYFLKKRIFVNPQLRGVVYIAPSVAPGSRAEALKPFFLLPAVSVGVRL